MTVWVALLRGVNVGGNRKLPMAAWRESLQRSGFADVRTYLQSGNAVFSHHGGHDDVLSVVEQGLRDDLGIETRAVLRPGDQLADVVARNPWPERVDEPTKLHVGFLSEPGPVEARRVGDDEEIRSDGGEVWVWYGSGAGQTKLALDVGGRVVTMRNWRSVLALADLAAS